MLQDIVWAIKASSVYTLLLPIFWQIAVCVAIYQFDYVYQLIRHLGIKVFGDPEAFRDGPADERPPIMVVMPTLLRNEDELQSLKDTIVSAASNGYPGELLIVASIDDRAAAPPLYDDLRRWTRDESWPELVQVHVTGTPRRKGKALAVERAVEYVRDLEKKGAIAAVPSVFFNMDADSTLGDAALERMVHTLMKRNRFTGQRALIASSNVAVRHDHYWRGWRWFFSIEGQLAIQIAREFMVTSGLGRHNSKLQPVVGVPGALYCTWTELYEQGPRYAAFSRTLTWGTWVRWWLGFAPPSFERSGVEPLPEAMTGPGDDTWVTWLAGSARWHNGRITLELPRTPLHAFYYLLRTYFVQRTVAYDPAARVFTVSPIRPKSLWRQRVRWNACRPDTVGRWFKSMLFHWQIGLPATFQLATTIVIVGTMVLGLLVLQVRAATATDLMVAYTLGFFAHLALFFVTSVIALVIDDDIRSTRKLLAVPLTPFYFMFFNLFPCVYGIVCDLFLFGNWTNFSPEDTLVRSRTTRVAILYRLRRAWGLAVRAVARGDVPFGRFWFGWLESKWTPNGFEGWTSGKRPKAVHPPERKVEAAVARAVVAPGDELAAEGPGRAHGHS